MAVKILVVEDDPLMSRMYQKVFTFEGYHVVLAADGQEGLDKARFEQPLIVLLDVMIPVLDGLQILEKLQLDPTTKQALVIMLTNLADQRYIEAALSKGAVKYIVKSEYDPKQIITVVKEVLADHTVELPG